MTGPPILGNKTQIKRAAKNSHASQLLNAEYKCKKARYAEKLVCSQH